MANFCEPKIKKMSLFNKSPLQQIIEGSYSTRSRNDYSKMIAIGFANWLLDRQYKPDIKSWVNFLGDTPSGNSTEYLFDEFIKEKYPHLQLKKSL